MRRVVGIVATCAAASCLYAAFALAILVDLLAEDPGDYYVGSRGGRP